MGVNLHISNRHKIKTTMFTMKLLFFALVAVTVLGDNIDYEDEIVRSYLESIKDEDEIIMEDEKPPFDPVEEMRKLWKAEVPEGEDFKAVLKEMGVNEVEWEEKFGQPEFADEEHGHHYDEL